MALLSGAETRQASSASETFVLRGGTWVADPVEAGFVRTAEVAQAAERGQLGYLLQSADARPLSMDLCSEVVAALKQAYYTQGGSVSHALHAALLAANETLFEHNIRADTESRLLLGIACVVVQGSQVYMGRLGPGCVWLITKDSLQQFPRESLWFRSVDSDPTATVDQEPPAGMRGDVEPDLDQVQLAEDTVVALLSQTLQRRAPAAELLRVLGQGDRDKARTVLQGLCQGRDLALLAVGVSGSPMPEPEETPVDEQATAETIIAEAAVEPETEATPAGEAEITMAAATAEAPEPIEEIGPAEARPEPTLAEPIGSAVEPIGSAAETVGSAPAAAQRPQVFEFDSGRPSAAQTRSRVRATMPEPDLDWEDEDDDDLDYEDELEEDYEDEESYGAAVAEPAPVSEPARRSRLFGGSGARSAGRAIKDGAEKVRDGVEDGLLKVLPDRLPERPDPERVQMPAISPASKSLVILALLLPLLVLFTVFMVRWQYDQEVEARRSSIRQTAFSDYDAALKASNTALQVEQLNDTLEQVELGLSILPGDDALTDLRKRVLRELDQAEGVERLYHFKRLDSYTTGGTVANEPSRVVVEDKSVLLLNKGAGQVLGYTLSDVGDAVSARAGTEVLLRSGEVIGATQVGQIVDIAWLAATGSRTAGSFVALDDTGTLWVLRDNEFYAAPVADSDGWVKPVAIGAYMGNLYVLDPMGDGILKYLTTENSYTTPPFPYLSSTVAVDMLSAVDMAIDGNIYVLFADGSIHKFFDGEEQPFSTNGLPSPIQNPTSIFVSGAQEPDADGYVYVTDRGNERIVQFDKSGNYVRSLKTITSEPYMTALGGLYVDESTQRLFIFNERQFVLASLPDVE